MSRRVIQDIIVGIVLLVFISLCGWVSWHYSPQRRLNAIEQRLERVENLTKGFAEIRQPGWGVTTVVTNSP